MQKCQKKPTLNPPSTPNPIRLGPLQFSQTTYNSHIPATRLFILFNPSKILTTSSSTLSTLLYHSLLLSPCYNLKIHTSAQSSNPLLFLSTYLLIFSVLKILRSYILPSPFASFFKPFVLLPSSNTQSFFFALLIVPYI